MSAIEELQRLLGEVTEDTEGPHCIRCGSSFDNVRQNITAARALLDNMEKDVRITFEHLAGAMEELKRVHGSDNVDAAEDYIIAAINRINGLDESPKEPVSCPKCGFPLGLAVSDKGTAMICLNCMEPPAEEHAVMPEKGLDLEGKRLSDTVWVPHREPLTKEFDIERLVEVAHVAYCKYWDYQHPELMKKGPAQAILHAILKDLGHEGETTDPYPTAISDPYGAPHAVEPERCPGEGAHPHTVCLGCGGCHSFVSCSNSTPLCSNKVGAQSLISTEEPGCQLSDAMGGTEEPDIIIECSKCGGPMEAPEGHFITICPTCDSELDIEELERKWKDNPREMLDARDRHVCPAEEPEVK